MAMDRLLLVASLVGALVLAGCTKDAPGSPRDGNADTKGGGTEVSGNMVAVEGNDGAGSTDRTNTTTPENATG